MTIKLYWENPYETTFSAEITMIKESGIVLDKTLFYPESGNQLSDRGFLTVKGSKIKIENVSKEEDDIIHHISPGFKEKIGIGDEVRGEIDWDYRFGLMKAHSSQHIFSAVLNNKYNIKTLRATLTFEEVFIQLSKKINYSQLREVLHLVNSICILNNLIIKSELKSHKEADKIAGKIRSKIPDEPQVRLIKIQDLDFVCCGGTHVKNTTEIGCIYLYDFKKGNEIKYYVGNKALQLSSTNNVDILLIANDLNTPITKFQEIVTKHLELKEDLLQQQKELSIKLLESLSKLPFKVKNEISYFYIDFDIDIKILNRSLKNFPQNSLIIVKMRDNKIRLLSLSEIIDANQLLQKMIEEFKGKGGGNPKSAQGVLKKMPKDLVSEIEKLVDN
jgi:alanyl-tRNA synthetase